MKKRVELIYLNIVFSLIAVNSETADWCKTKGISIDDAVPLHTMQTRSRIECVMRCKNYNSPSWPCYTAVYQSTRCLLYSQSTFPEGCDRDINDDSNNNNKRYITRKIKSPNWIPLFRAYNGSGISVYNTWSSNNVILTNNQGVSPLLLQLTLWGLIKELKLSMYEGDNEVAYISFNALESNRSDWFSRSRIIDSTYRNIKNDDYRPNLPKAFSIEGYLSLSASIMRRFYAHWYHYYCPGDKGWLVVLDELPGKCQWEKNGIRPTFLYCEGLGPCKYEKMKSAEMLLVSGRF